MGTSQDVLLTSEGNKCERNINKSTCIAIELISEVRNTAWPFLDTLSVQTIQLFYRMTY